jgi:predicted  nucleic acid-binding Zn-ribbon protein
VGDEGKAPEARPLAQIAALNDRLDTLKALRDKLALAIDATESSRDLAALSRQLTDVLAQIEEIEKSLPAKKDTPLDAVKKNRAARSTRAKD